MQANQFCLLAALSAADFHREKVVQAISLKSIENHQKTVEDYDNFINQFYGNPINESSVTFLVEKGFIDKKTGTLTHKGKVQVSQDPMYMTAKDLGIKFLFMLVALKKRDLLESTLTHFNDDMVNYLLDTLLMEVVTRADQKGFTISNFALETCAGIVVTGYPQVVEEVSEVTEVAEVPFVHGELIALEEEVKQEVINLAKPKKSRKKTEKVEKTIESEI